MNEKKYVLTPKALAILALMQVGLITSMDDPRADGFWTIFESNMREKGYVQEGGAE